MEHLTPRHRAWTDSSSSAVIVAEPAYKSNSRRCNDLPLLLFLADAGASSVQSRRRASSSSGVGEFSTGTMGNFAPALTSESCGAAGNRLLHFGVPFVSAQRYLAVSIVPKHHRPARRTRFTTARLPISDSTRRRKCSSSGGTTALVMSSIFKGRKGES